MSPSRTLYTGLQVTDSRVSERGRDASKYVGLAGLVFVLVMFAAAYRLGTAGKQAAALRGVPMVTLDAAIAANATVAGVYVETCSADGEDCSGSQCCQSEGKQCYRKSPSYAGCMALCPATDWTCDILDPRTPLKHPGSCSKQDENCLITQCCEAPGARCYQNNDYWGGCFRVCDPSFEYTQNWTCKEIGKVTPEVCSWSGMDCGHSKKCCHPGAKCYAKNAMEAYCITPGVEVDASWTGQVLGDSMWDFEVAPVDAAIAKGTTLFCLMAVLPGSSEEQLIALAKQKNASIFACDAQMRVDSWRAPMQTWGTGFTTLVNADVFLDVWRHVKDDGRYKNYDWTAKIDPDSVFFPDRLRYHLAQLHAPKRFPIYIKNTPFNFGLFGAIEVFSKEAMDKYFGRDNLDDNDKHCLSEITTNAGEDGFMQNCMTMLGAGYMRDYEVLNNPAETNCAIGSRVCFHAFKSVERWEACYNVAVR